jgi:hypothetical protein
LGASVTCSLPADHVPTDVGRSCGIDELGFNFLSHPREAIITLGNKLLCNHIVSVEIITLDVGD